jgi:hypothetical protein
MGGLTNRANKMYRSTERRRYLEQHLHRPAIPRPLPFIFGLLLHDVQQPALLAAHGLG